MRFVAMGRAVELQPVYQKLVRFFAQTTLFVTLHLSTSLGVRPAFDAVHLNLPFAECMISVKHASEFNCWSAQKADR